MLVINARAVFSECRKPKPKVITLTNHKGHTQSNEPIKTPSKARENECEGITIGFSFTSDLIKKVARVF